MLWIVVYLEYGTKQVLSGLRRECKGQIYLNLDRIQLIKSPHVFCFFVFFRLVTQLVHSKVLHYCDIVIKVVAVVFHRLFSGKDFFDNLQIQFF